MNLIDLNQLSCVGESASLFIDEGDGLTSERERVRMLSKSCCPRRRVQVMVGAHNTILVSDACGRLRRLLQVWQTSMPATLLIPRAMKGVLPFSPGTVNDGAYNTVDASEARGRNLTVFVWYRI